MRVGCRGVVGSVKKVCGGHPAFMDHFVPNWVMSVKILERTYFRSKHQWELLKCDVKYDFNF